MSLNATFTVNQIVISIYAITYVIRPNLAPGRVDDIFTVTVITAVVVLLQIAKVHKSWSIPSKVDKILFSNIKRVSM